MKCPWCEKNIDFRKNPFKVSVEQRHPKKQDGFSKDQSHMERHIIEQWFCDTWCIGCYIGQDFKSDKEVNGDNNE